MSNSQKISQMTSASTPLTGAELVPLVQNGQNVRATVTQLGAVNNLQYQGTWNASTNSPTITSSTGTAGYYYIVNTAGTTNIDGISSWAVGDWIIFSNTGVWQKIGGGTVSSIQIVNDASSNTNYNIPLTSASSGLINTEYVDNGDLKYNPSTGKLTAPQITLTTSTAGTFLEGIGNSGGPQIGFTDTSNLHICGYDNLDPDAGVYNYSLWGDGSYIGFFMSEVATKYDLGTTRFIVSKDRAIYLAATEWNQIAGNPSGFGTAGQVIASAGPAAAAYWANVGSLPSLQKMKANIAPITDVSWVANLNPVSYNKRKQDAEGNYTDEVHAEKEFGLIAEEVEAVNPELCFYKDGELAGVNYLQLTTVLLKKVQELEAKIAVLEAK